jgi:hypothetical protein
LFLPVSIHTESVTQMFSGTPVRETAAHGGFGFGLPKS